MSAPQKSRFLSIGLIAGCLIFLLVPLLFTACNSESDAANQQSDSITVIGMLEAGGSDSIALQATTHPAHVISGEGSTLKQVALFPNRTFEIRAFWPHEGTIDITYDGVGLLRDVYMRPGDTLTLRLDGEDVIAVGSALYEFQQEFGRRFFDDEPVQTEYQRRFTLAPLEYAAYIDRRLTDQVDMVRRAYPLGTEDSLFMQHMMDRVEYSWAYDRLQYAWNTSEENKAVLRDIHTNYYEFLSSVRTNNPDALDSDEYLAFLLGYTEYLYDSLTTELASGTEQIDMQRITSEAAARIRLIEEYFDGKVEETAKALYLHSEIKTMAFLSAADTQSASLFSFLEQRRNILDSLYTEFRNSYSDSVFQGFLSDYYISSFEKPSLPDS